MTKPHSHLAQFLCHGPTYHSHAMWRHSRTAAPVTTHIGLAATFSISHQHPFYAARLWATLDHLTRAGGRHGTRSILLDVEAVQPRAGRFDPPLHAHVAIEGQ